MFKIALPTLVIRKFDLNDGTGDGPRIEIAGPSIGADSVAFDGNEDQHTNHVQVTGRRALGGFGGP